MKTGLRIHKAGLALLSAGLFALCVTGGTPTQAQSLFSPVVRINDSVVTEWEVDQRTRFLALFRTPGDLREIAIERLTEERLQVDAAEAEGITATPEAIEAGMAEFAARVELTTDQFLTAIGQGGVTEEAFRDFVRAGLVWRELVRNRFATEVRPEPEEIDARVLEVGTEGGTRVLLNEIILPADDPATRAASLARAAELASLTTEAEFREAAGRFSRAPTRTRGGELDWLALTGLPEQVQPFVAEMSPGRVSRPIDLGTSIALFYMREREEIRAAAPTDRAVDYAILNAGTATEASRVAGRIRTCDDLYGVARTLPEDRLRRETVPREALPASVAAAIADLDPGEATTLPGDSSALLMFCGEKLDTEAVLNRDAVASELVNRTLGQRAARLLAELRAKAVITRVE